jgi:carbamoyltransferase
MIIWGWSGMAHDASLAVFKQTKKGLGLMSTTELLFAAHSERYSRIKNDKNLHLGLINDALQFGKPNKIYYYEKPLLKKTRQVWAGQYNLLGKESPTRYMRNFYPEAPKSSTCSHHLSHAAAGYYTSPYKYAAVLVIDSIGEWDTMSIWNGNRTELKKKWSQYYPHSIGIWYSAMTQRIGLKPQEHEYILMGMAAIGDASKYYDLIKRDFIKKLPSLKDPRTLFKLNCHRGCLDWRPDLNSVQDVADIAAATQLIYEEIFEEYLKIVRDMTGQDSIVLMGGCALNCVANTIAAQYFKNVWIMPNPGDAGSAIGCVLAKEKTFIKFDHAYLGHDIVGDYPIENVIGQLLEKKITAVACGRAEFGPRSLGNRSILADPRGPDVKDRVNQIKHREAFRPFAPMILEEHADTYFDMPSNVSNSPFMQFVVECKYPDKFPAIVHFDNTSRVQTVGKDDGPVRELLEQWYKRTGCPILLNTSLNIRNEPLVNTRADAHRWSAQYGVEICLPE